MPKSMSKDPKKKKNHSTRKSQKTKQHIKTTAKKTKTTISGYAILGRYLFYTFQFLRVNEFHDIYGLFMSREKSHVSMDVYIRKVMKHQL